MAQRGVSKADKRREHVLERHLGVWREYAAQEKKALIERLQKKKQKQKPQKKQKLQTKQTKQLEQPKQLEQIPQNVNRKKDRKEEPITTINLTNTAAEVKVIDTEKEPSIVSLFEKRSKSVAVSISNTKPGEDSLLLSPMSSYLDKQSRKESSNASIGVLLQRIEDENKDKEKVEVTQVNEENKNKEEVAQVKEDKEKIEVTQIKENTPSKSVIVTHNDFQRLLPPIDTLNRSAPPPLEMVEPLIEIEQPKEIEKSPLPQLVQQEQETETPTQVNASVSEPSRLSEPSKLNSSLTERISQQSVSNPNNPSKLHHPNQSFIGLKPNELKEKSAELNQLLKKLIKTGATNNTLAVNNTSAVEPTITPIRKPQECPVKKPFSPVVDSSDDDSREIKYPKRPWVDSPSLPHKLLMQDEAQATKIFGTSDNTKVNLREMFSEMANLPPDTPK